MKTVLITGGSGMVGSRLTSLLTQMGYHVIWYSRERDVSNKTPRYKWDYRRAEIDKVALELADYIIHLSGASIGDGLWTKKRKSTIVDSRVETAHLMLEALKVIGKKPEAFVSASAVGYYGIDINESVFTEEDELNGSDFLSTTCRHWEDAANRFSDELGIRTVVLRTGVVISSNSEAFKKMMMPVRLGVGSPLGKGRQYLSWIHIDDLCNMYLKAIEDVDMKGVYNAVAPDYTTNAEFMSHLARGMGRPFVMPKVPEFVMRLVMGESADLVLGGSRISSNKIQQVGFKFEYPNVDKVIMATLNSIDSEKEEH